MNLTIVTGYYPPELSADTHLVQDLAEGLSTMGFSVTVVTPFPIRNVPCDVQLRYVSRSCETVSGSLRIIRVGKPQEYKSGLVVRATRLLKKTYELYSAAKRSRPDVLLVTSTPPFLGYAAAKLAREYPVVYKLQDLFPENLKLYKKRGIAIPYSFFDAMSKRVYKSCSKIATSSFEIRDTVLNKGGSEDRVSVIYDWVDSNQCMPIQRSENPLFDEYHLDRSKFYACYAGNIGKLQNLSTIVRAARYTNGIDPNVHYVVIGNGSAERAIRSMLDEEPLDTFHMIPLQSPDRVSYAYSLGDIGLVSLKPGVARCAFPSKTWSILSAARPAICEVDDGSSICRLIDQYECGSHVESGDHLALAKTVLEYRNDENRAKAEGAKGREVIEKYLTKEKALAAYSTLLENAVVEYRNDCKQGERR